MKLTNIYYFLGLLASLLIASLGFIIFIGPIKFKYSYFYINLFWASIFILLSILMFLRTHNYKKLLAKIVKLEDSKYKKEFIKIIIIEFITILFSILFFLILNSGALYRIFGEGETVMGG